MSPSWSPPTGFSAAAPPARPDELLDATGDEDTTGDEADTACADGDGEREVCGISAPDEAAVAALLQAK